MRRTIGGSAPHRCRSHARSSAHSLSATATCWFYNPPKDEWTEGPRMNLPRVQHAAVQLANGDILFIGGDGAASGTSERYDFRLGIFVRSGTLGDPRQAARAAALPDGRVVVVG